MTEAWQWQSPELFDFNVEWIDSGLEWFNSRLEPISSRQNYWCSVYLDDVKKKIVFTVLKPNKHIQGFSEAALVKVLKIRLREFSQI